MQEQYEDATAYIKDLPKWLPASVHQSIETRFSKKDLKLWLRARPIFFDYSLKDFWSLLEKRQVEVSWLKDALAADVSHIPFKNDEAKKKWISLQEGRAPKKNLIDPFIDEIVFQIPLKYWLDHDYADLRKQQLMDTIKKLDQAIETLGFGSGDIKKVRERYATVLETDFIQKNKRTTKHGNHHPVVRTQNECMYYKRALEFWFKRYTRKKHGKYIDFIADDIFDNEFFEALSF